MELSFLLLQRGMSILQENYDVASSEKLAVFSKARAKHEL